MSGECDKCGEHCLDCKCSLIDRLQPFCRRQQNDPQPSVEIMGKAIEHLNPKIIPLDAFSGINPPAERPETKYINVNGREEHEAVIKDAAKCKELGLDQMYETMVYLKRWGGWLDNPEKPA